MALAHRSCPFTGEVIGAAGGKVYRAFMAQTPGARASEPFTPEQFMELLPDVWCDEGYWAIGLVTPGQRAQTTPVTEIPPEERPRSSTRDA